jgi:hypothetical protein
MNVKKMHVYLVLWFDKQGVKVDKIFSTHRAAKKYIDRYNHRCGDLDSAIIKKSVQGTRVVVSDLLEDKEIIVNYNSDKS